MLLCGGRVRERGPELFDLLKSKSESHSGHEGFPASLLRLWVCLFSSRLFLGMRINGSILYFFFFSHLFLTLFTFLPNLSSQSSSFFLYFYKYSSIKRRTSLEMVICLNRSALFAYTNIKIDASYLGKKSSSSFFVSSWGHQSRLHLVGSKLSECYSFILEGSWVQIS